MSTAENIGLLDEDSEKAFIAILLSDQSLIEKVISKIQPKHFGYPNYKLLYKGIVKLWKENKVESGEPVDLVKLKYLLVEHGKWEKVKIESVKKIIDCFRNEASFEYYADKILDCYRLRKAHNVYKKLGQFIKDPTLSATDKCSKFIVAAEKITDLDLSAKTTDIKVQARCLFSEIRKQAEGAIVTGLDSIDEKFDGLFPGEYTILAARPSMGKSTLALNIADYIAQDYPVGFFSLEMDRHGLLERLLSAKTGFSLKKLRKSHFIDEQLKFIQECEEMIAGLNLYIDDTPAMKLAAFKTAAKLMKIKNDVKIIFIDYLQLMTCDGKTSRQEEVSEISRTLLATCKELNVHIFALAQLNRESENRKVTRPKLTDLRESGSLEQDAYNVLLLHRGDYKREREVLNAVLDGEAEVIIAKHRQGECGICKLTYLAEEFKFCNPVNENELDEPDWEIPD